MPLLLPTPPTFGYFLTNDDSPGSSTTFGTSITASGSTNTKGTWTTLGMTPSYDLYYHRVHFAANGTAATDMNGAAASRQGLMDIGYSIDGGTTVFTIVENLIVGSTSVIGGQNGRVYELPFYVPSGSTIYARLQSNVASATCRIAIMSWGGLANPEQFPRVGMVEAIGAATGTSVGTSITPGASGAMGAYAQMVASAANNYIGITMGEACTDTTMAAVNYTGLVGIGAATEQELGLCYWSSHNGAEWINSTSFPLWANIPTGIRIALKMSCTGTSDSSITAAAYGFVRG